MKIYTKTGDDGTTGLYGGKRIPKYETRIEAYGSVDELNSWIGLLRDQDVNALRVPELIQVQNKLFVIGAILAADPEKKGLKIPVLVEEDVEMLEKFIDRMESELTLLSSFILPGGDQRVSFTHIARTVCRRAERQVVLVHHQEAVNPLVIKYLNRLSDALFVMARSVAKEIGVKEEPWRM